MMLFCAKEKIANAEIKLGKKNKCNNNKYKNYHCTGKQDSPSSIFSSKEEAQCTKQHLVGETGEKKTREDEKMEAC